MSAVLVVDDDSEIARFIEATLATEGFDVVVAHGGDEAIKRLDEAMPDLALIDVLMPGLDGVAAIMMRWQTTMLSRVSSMPRA